jgi:hypothetical protein
MGSCGRGASRRGYKRGDYPIVRASRSGGGGPPPHRPRALERWVPASDLADVGDSTFVSHREHLDIINSDYAELREGDLDGDGSPGAIVRSADLLRSACG